MICCIIHNNYGTGSNIGQELLSKPLNRNSWIHLFVVVTIILHLENEFSIGNRAMFCSSMKNNELPTFPCWSLHSHGLRFTVSPALSESVVLVNPCFIKIHKIVGWPFMVGHFLQKSWWASVTSFLSIRNWWPSAFENLNHICISTLWRDLMQPVKVFLSSFILYKMGISFLT